MTIMMMRKQMTNLRSAMQQEPRRRGPNKRKRQPLAMAMDYEQTIIPVHIYQHWLQNASDIVSRRGRKKKKGFQRTILQNHHFRRLHQEYRMKISCNLRICNFFLIKCPNVKPFEDFDSRLDYQAPPIEKQRKNILVDELTHSLLRGPEATPQISSVKAGGDSVHSFPRPASEHGPASHSDFDSGRTMNRFKKKRYSSSGNSSGGLEPLAEDVNFKLAGLYEDGPTPDQELLVETGPTQTQVNINHPSDKITDSIQA
ncbi:Sister chromatid cohesion 1 protein 1, partial [Mucuna pruriens]